MWSVGGSEAVGVSRCFQVAHGNLQSKTSLLWHGSVLSRKLLLVVVWVCPLVSWLSMATYEVVWQLLCWVWL